MNTKHIKHKDLGENHLGFENRLTIGQLYILLTSFFIYNAVQGSENIQRESSKELFEMQQKNDVPHAGETNSGKSNIITQLLHAGSVITASDSVTNKTDDNALNDLGLKVINALENNKPDEANRLIEIGINVNIKDHNNFTPLQSAIWYKSEILKKYNDLIKLLIDSKANVDVNRTDWQPLHLAARAGDLDTVKLLINNKADVHSKNKIGETPFHEAAAGGNKDIVSLLIKDTDVNVQDPTGRTALHKAASRGYKDIVQLLIDNKADVNIKSRSGQTPLENAISGNQNEIVELLKSAGAQMSDVK